MAVRSRHECFGLEDAAALARCAKELGLAIPFSDDLSVLFEPLEIAGRKVSNRFVVQPMEGCDADLEGAPGPLTQRRYQRYAAGGSGLIWFEATAVVRAGRANPRQLWITRANVGAFQRLVEATRAAAQAHGGAGHRVLLVLQLTHSGRYARPDGRPQPIIGQHNPLLDTALGIGAEHPLISDAALDRLQDAFADAAELAVRAGFDGVDIKACHGYLVSELLAAFARPNSRYGGSFEQRALFLREVVARVRDRAPGIFVTSRFSAHDGLPRPYGFGGAAGEPPAEELAEPLELVQRLHALGCPLLNVSLGNPYHNPHYGRPFDRPVEGAACPHEHPLVGVARLLRITATVQRAVPDVPVVGTGYSWLRHLFPNVAAGVLARGDAALVGLGRQAFAYPDCVRDLRETGALDPARTCTACSGCSQMMRDGVQAGCCVRDSEIYVEEYRRGRARDRCGAGDTQA